MILDWSEPYYVLRVPRVEADPNELMLEYGLDLSVPASTDSEAVLFTTEPFAAATFAHVATTIARQRLHYICSRLERSWAATSGRHIETPSGEELWPFQIASVDYAMDCTHALVADEPGLGKTPIAISVANEIQADRCLVVCPASIRFQWLRRIDQWSLIGKRWNPPSSVNLSSYAIVSSQRGVHPSAAWTVISWDLVRSPGLWKALAAQEFDYLILDEAHYAKTNDAGRTRAIFGGGRNPVAKPIAERAKRIVALTGTPLPNRPREAYVLARNLCWESIDFLSERSFNERFNPRRLNEAKNGGIWSEEHIGRTAELQNRLRGNFMVRHLKRDVMPQLKMPVFDLIRVEETKAVKAALEAERLLDINPDHLDGANAEVLGHIAEARRIMGVAMAPQVADWINMLFDGGEDKLVVFAWHIEVLDILCAKLAKHGVVRVDGRDSARAKDRKVQDFINNPHAHIIIGNVMSLGTGIDGLQRVANHALLAEADWVNGNNQQCFDRLDRGGQKQQVQGDIFVAPGSIAERVLAAALYKGQVVHKALDRHL